MATVVGIFKDCFKKKKLPVVKLGIQARRFTHVYDTVKVCIFAWKK
jgi:UDP-glucose 4-epimerase